MLISVNGNRPFFEDTGANSVGALAVLAPDCTCPKTPGVKRRIIHDRTSPVDHKPAVVRQQNRTADPAYGTE
jgi:hypothetical protein